MKKVLFGCVTIAALAASQSGLAADEWTTLPVLDDGFEANPQIALAVGSLNPTGDLGDAGRSDTLDIAFDCLLLAAPDSLGNIRTHLSLTGYESNSLSIDTIEINPMLHFYESGNMTIGAGPGIGYATAKYMDTSVAKKQQEDSYLTLQLGAVLEFRTGDYVVGAGTRYQASQGADLAGESNLNNWNSYVKFGVDI